MKNVLASACLSLLAAACGGGSANEAPDAPEAAQDGTDFPLMAGGGSPGDLSSEATEPEAPPPISECETPSISRFQQWLASGEGPTEPTEGTLLVPQDDTHEAQATFTSNSEWHVLAIWLGNEFGASIDLTESAGFTLTYSATSDFYVQLRPASEWSGGSKWHLSVPATNGEVVTSNFSFNPEHWKERLGPPPHTFLEALSDASGFVVVGNSTNELTFSGLEIDGYVPPCL